MIKSNISNKTKIILRIEHVE